MGLVESGILGGSGCISSLLFQESGCLNVVGLNVDVRGETRKAAALQQIAGSVLALKVVVEDTKVIASEMKQLI